MQTDFYNQVLPAIEKALLTDLPDIEYQYRLPGQKPGPDAKTETRRRRPNRWEVEIYTFPQSWSDTSMGFGGMAGQAFTSAYTTVIISHHRQAAVYIGGRLAYVALLTQELMEDVRNHCMRGRVENPSQRYKLIGRKQESDEEI